MSSQIKLIFLYTIFCDRIPCEFEFAHKIWCIPYKVIIIPGGTNKGGVSST